MDENILSEMIKLMKKSIKKSEVPVSALIIKDNKIISKSYNTRKKTNNVLNHAEIIAIIKANKKLKNWRLNDCILYTSLEPCPMCKKVIEESRIKKVYYVLKRKNKEINKDIYNQINTKKSAECEKIIVDFFKSKR